jgi:hypothetical protein
MADSLADTIQGAMAQSFDAEAPEAPASPEPPGDGSIDACLDAGFAEINAEREMEQELAPFEGIWREAGMSRAQLVNGALSTLQRMSADPAMAIERLAGILCGADPGQADALLQSSPPLPHG